MSVNNPPQITIKEIATKRELRQFVQFGIDLYKGNVLGEEIDALGLKRIETMDGRVIFEGEEGDIPRANIALRCAERVFVLMGRFHAETFDQLYEGTRALSWADWIGKTDAFPISGHSIKSRLTSIPASFSC